VKVFFLGLMAVLPGTAAAAVPGPVRDFLNRVSENIINPLIFLLFAIAFAAFVWGMVGYLSKLDSPDGRSQGSRHMLWGLVGMAVMLGAYAIKTVAENLLK